MRKSTRFFQALVVLICAVIMQSSAAGAGAEEKGRYSWLSGDYRVERDNKAGVLRLLTDYYTFEHDLNRGGAISRVSLRYGKVKNMLVEPMGSSVRLKFEEGRGSEDVFSDLNCSAPDVREEKSDGGVIVTVESELADKKGGSSGVRVKTVYNYRWGYVKIHKEFISDRVVKLRNLTTVSTMVDWSLEDYGYRPAIFEVMGSSTHSWQSDQIRRWGKIRPGRNFDLPFSTRYIPRYLVLANQQVEGIEWFLSDDLQQWDYQVSGVPGTGYCEISASTKPLGISVLICPLNLEPRYDLEKGGYVEFKGRSVFDYYIGVPILEGHAHNPWFNKSYDVSGGKWISEEQIKRNSQDGVVTMHLHNDGDGLGDGLFWRDGSYPPYPAEEMKKMDEVIAMIHKYGMKTAPYFSNHELHQSTQEFREYGEQWGRKPDDRGNLRPNYYYGALMCLKSGWSDFLKLSIDRVLRNHDFDGVYYDWNIAMYCNNPLHVGKSSNGVVSEKGIGAYAVSQTGHWDIDELIDLLEWTRRRVGKDGIIILHNTLVPMFATENFANYVVGMEFSYGKLSVSMPRPEELPLEWSFVQSRPRAVIGYGTITADAPESLRKDHAVTTLMTSVAPWPASKEAIDLYKILKPLGDLEQWRFEDWRNKAVIVNDKDCFSAVYSRGGQAYILLANTTAENKRVRCVVQPEQLSYPLKGVKSAEIIGKGSNVKLDADRLFSRGEIITVGADDVTMIHIE